MVAETANPGEVITMYAEWEKVTVEVTYFTIKYNANGGTINAVDFDYGSTYDGSGVTVDFAPADGEGIGMWHSSDGFELYAVGNSDSKRSTDITIKNVKFKLSGTGTCGSQTYSTAQLYLYATANVTFENCVFENVSVSMNGSAASAKATFKDCTFDSVKNYAIKYVENVEVLDCSFNACSRAMMLWSDGSKTPADVVTISGCEFTNITKDRIIKFYNFVTDAETQVQIMDNTVAASSTADFIIVDFDSGYNPDDYTYNFVFTGNSGVDQDNLNENNTEKALYLSRNSLVDDESAVVPAAVTTSVQSVNLFGAVKVDGGWEFESAKAEGRYLTYEGVDATGAVYTIEPGVAAGCLSMRINGVWSASSENGDMGGKYKASNNTVQSDQYNWSTDWKITEYEIIETGATRITEAKPQAQPIYHLSGVRVNKVDKGGVYIQGGNKIVAK